MSRALIPLVVVVVGFVAQFFLQLNTRSRYDYRCRSCGSTFSPSPLALTLAPHRLGGLKYTRCPRCGVRSWVEPVAKT